MTARYVASNQSRPYPVTQGSQQGRPVGGAVVDGIVQVLALGFVALVLVKCLTALLGDASTARHLVLSHGALLVSAMALGPAALAVWVAYDRNAHKRKAWRRWKPVAVTAAVVLAALVAVECRSRLFSMILARLVA